MCEMRILLSEFKIIYIHIIGELFSCSDSITLLEITTTTATDLLNILEFMYRHIINAFLNKKKCGMCVRRSETKFSSKKFHVYVVRAFNGMKLRKIFLERYTNKNRCEMNALVFYPWNNLIFLFSKITPAPVSVSKSFPVRYKKSFDKNSHNNCFTIKWKLRVAMLLDSILM